MSHFIPSVMIPGHAAGVGSLHRFDCRLGYQSVQGEIVLARWFKDGQEFYRFQSKGTPEHQVFNVPGVNVDEDESGASVVALYDMDQSSSGRYKCLLSTNTETENGDLALLHEFNIAVEHPDESLFRQFTVRKRWPITTALKNSTVAISCLVHERPEKVYSYNWFKDDKEFYRFVPWNTEQPETVFDLPGVEVDLERSNGTDVMLVDVGTNSTGLYKCLASTEAAPNRTLVHRVVLEFSVPVLNTTET